MRGLADTLPLPPMLLDDLRTAVTEACNNVVQHAYNGEVGALLIDVALQHDAIEVTVRDRGRGMQPWIRTPAANTLGIGLMVIKALAERMEVRDAPEGGIEIMMRFATPGLSPPDPGGAIPHAPEPPEDAVSSAAISVTPARLAGGVLPRILSAMAARAHFTTDRIADLHVLGDTVAAHAHAVALNGHLCIRIGTFARDIRLSLSPLRVGGANTLLQQTPIDRVRHVLGTIVDEHQVLLEDGSETLQLRVLDRR
jgi:anti-sigma regulatory factor (Ser/Thr protein kinase)